MTVVMNSDEALALIRDKLCSLEYKDANVEDIGWGFLRLDWDWKDSNHQHFVTVNWVNKDDVDHHIDSIVYTTIDSKNVNRVVTFSGTRDTTMSYRLTRVSSEGFLNTCKRAVGSSDDARTLAMNLLNIGLVLKGKKG